MSLFSDKNCTMTKFSTPLLNIVLSRAITVAVVCVTFLLTVHFKSVTSIASLQNKSTEELYLPDIRGLRLLSVGFDKALGHILWFKTINYFGKQLQGDRDYQYLNHYINLVINLNPNLDYVYEFGVTMLSWETNQPDEALKLLDRAIIQFPYSWYFRYLRGFTYLYFLNDPQKAKIDYTFAASLPNTPQSIKELADEDFSKVSSKFNAMRMLQGLIATAPDEQTKKILQQKLIELTNSSNGQ